MGSDFAAGLDFAVVLEFEAGIEPGKADLEEPMQNLCYAAIPFSRVTSYRSA